MQRQQQQRRHSAHSVRKLSALGPAEHRPGCPLLRAASQSQAAQWTPVRGAVLAPPCCCLRQQCYAGPERCGCPCCRRRCCWRAPGQAAAPCATAAAGRAALLPQHSLRSCGCCCRPWHLAAARHARQDHRCLLQPLLELHRHFLHSAPPHPLQLPGCPSPSCGQQSHTNYQASCQACWGLLKVFAAAQHLVQMQAHPTAALTC